MSALLVVVVLVGVIVAVAVARDRAGDAATSDGAGGHNTLRRVFVYSLALLGAVLTASGLSGALRVALATFGASALVRDTDRALALGLALTLVGLPVWMLAWRAAGRQVERSVGERWTRGRRLHLNAVRIIALGVAIPAAVQTGLWLVAVEPYDAGPLARLLVWGALWAYHECVAGEVAFGSERTRRSDRVEVYVAATAGFALLASSIGRILTRSMEAVFDVVARSDVLIEGASLGFELRSAVAGAVVGVAVWWWHWFAAGSRDAGSVGWFVYVFLVGVLSGTVTAVISASILLHRVLAWALAATEQPASLHFDVVPQALAALAVGIAVWGYHRAALREALGPSAERGKASVSEPEGGDQIWSGPERIYRYLVTAAGMLTAAGGVATILTVGFDLTVPGRTLIEAPGGVRDVVATGVTLLLVGAPLWAVFWQVVQRQVQHHPAERTALARRILIFGAFGAAIIVAVVALSILLVELLEALLSGQVSATLIEEQRWSIGLVLTAAAVSVHYGLVLREDRAAAPSIPPPVEPRHIVVVVPRSAELAGRLGERLDAGVTVWERDDLTVERMPDALVDTIANDVAATAAQRVIVIVEEDGTVRSLPLRAT
jgi:hypothetical protein